MKSFARQLFRLMARMILRRYHPVVIGVAGSVGKTATKDAIAAGIVHEGRRVRKTSGNFNAEIGVPATIVSSHQPPRNSFGWLRMAWQGKRHILFGGSYPSHLVLEMGADHPGDLQHLLDVASPTIGVLTSAAPEHLEFFGSVESVVAEESLIVRRLNTDQTAVVNIDDARIAEVLPSLVSRVITYGWHSNATIRAEHLSIVQDAAGLPSGMVVKVTIDGSTIPIALPGVIGRHQVYPILAALGVGRALGDDVMSVIQHLSAYVPPPGRMRVFAGKEHTVIIDDSYNASPEAVQAALHTIHELDIPGQRIAILGQMSELGSSSAEWHDRIGKEIASLRVHHLITVGPLAERIGTAAISAGMNAQRVRNVATAEAAAAAALPLLQSGSAVLLKGSRFASRLERAVKILLENPERDTPFLVGHHEV